MKASLVRQRWVSAVRSDSAEHKDKLPDCRNYPFMLMLKARLHFRITLKEQNRDTPLHMPIVLFCLEGITNINIVAGTA